MKAAIYNPYLDTLGGGERYTADFAKVLLENGYEVHLQWIDEGIKKELENRFSVNLDDIKIVDDIKRGDSYDLCFWLSDGSIPLLRSRKNILHFQHPFKSVNGSSLLNRMKIFRISKVICNSEFTKKFIDKEYSIKSKVVYPAIDVKSFKPKKKENLILTTGRFSQLEQAKRQDELIEVFKKMVDEGLKNWEFKLAGGAEVGASKFIKKIRKMTSGYPIEIIESPEFSYLIELYGKAKIYWSASGYGINELKEPKKVEHFGISVLESMSARAAPLAFDAGGHKEIIRNEVNGYLWKKKSKLQELTLKLIEDYKLWKNISTEAYKTSKNFSYDKFKKEVEKLL